MTDVEQLILKNQLAILGYLCNQSICEMSKMSLMNDFRKEIMKDNHVLVDAYQETNKVLKSIKR
jgi:hypothetical protein